MRKVIGFYDHTVVLTYGGLIFALGGIICAFRGAFPTALLLLAGSLFCDTMDGKVARSKKNRTAEEKQFGVQIDSLCDMVSFGVFPAVLCYSWGLTTGADFALMAFYCLCCVIRLAYFNVLAQNKTGDEPSAYHGLPVVGLAMVIPAAWLLGIFLPPMAFRWVLRGLLLVFGWLYILDFPVNKPKIWQLAIMAVMFFVPLFLAMSLH